MKSIIAVITCLFIFSAFNAQITKQSKNTLEKTQNTKFAYSVSNVVSFEQVKLLQTDYEKLKHVAKVKLNYKEEKPSHAQIIIFVSEPARTSEGQLMFDPVKLKQLLISKNLTISDLKISKY